MAVSVFGMERDVVVKCHILAIRIAKHSLYLRAPMTLDMRDLDASVVDNGTANFPGLVAVVEEVTIQGIRRRSVHNDEAHGILMPEVAFHSKHSSGKKTGLVKEGVVRPLVNVQSPVRRKAVQ